MLCLASLINSANLAEKEADLKGEEVEILEEDRIIKKYFEIKEIIL